MLDVKSYCAVDLVFLNTCHYVNLVTEYTHSPKMRRLHAVYSTETSRKKVIEAEDGLVKIQRPSGLRLRHLKKDFAETFSYICTPDMNFINLHWLDHLADDIADLDASVYEPFRFHLKSAHQGSRSRIATRK